MGAPDASAAAEKFGSTRDEILTDQHAWTEEQFRSRVTETLEGFGNLTEIQQIQMTELLMRHRHLCILKIWVLSISCTTLRSR